MSQQQPEQPDLAPKANPIMSEPATVDACASDLRTPREQVMAMADAAAQRGSIQAGGIR